VVVGKRGRPSSLWSEEKCALVTAKQEFYGTAQTPASQWPQSRRLRREGCVVGAVRKPRLAKTQGRFVIQKSGQNSTEGVSNN